jgi:3-oxoacyl-(acyl-carrier-protein) synthase
MLLEIHSERVESPRSLYTCKILFNVAPPLDTKYVPSGAVKSNIGHLEGGSGLAGLIKAILVLERAIIPPNANYDAPNPRIDTEMLNIKVGDFDKLRNKG